MNKALAVLDRLDILASDSACLPGITEAFRMSNAKLYLAFQAIQWGKRKVNKVQHGLLTFGDVPPPVPLYQGPTGRRALAAQNTAMVAVNAGAEHSLPRQFADGEGNSLGNVSRGERI